MTVQFKPKFRLTVTRDFFEAVSATCGQHFADSYLYGAVMSGARLTPRTLTGYRQMRDSTDFLHLLKTLEVVLVEPKPFHLSGNQHYAGDPY